LPFRVLSGEQGSGKSTLERLMIRLLKDDGWHIVIINPETNPAVWSGVQVLADAEEINEFFEAFPKTIRERQQQARNIKIDEDDYLDYIKDKSGLDGKVAVFLMESNTYEVHGVDPDLWANFLKQSLTNIRKWGYTVCLTAHSDNQTSIATKLKGFSGMIDDAPRVDCIAKAGKNGEATSSGKALLKMKGVRDKEPLEVDLYNYPKSKNFGSESVAQSPPVQTKQQSTASNGD
jgi:energy-coupling factor transporter ATP-binding protein EcfA2